MQSIKNLKNLKNKKILIRVDFNVPIKNDKVIDNLRLVSHLETIHFLIKKGAKIILMAHLGRPKGKVVQSLKLDPVAKELSKLLKKKVKKIETKSFKNIEAIQKELNSIRSGQVVLLDNIRFSPDEKNNTGTLAADLSSLADIFVLDGFGVAHRSSASVVGIAQYLPSYAGLLLDHEITTLTKVIKNPKQPFVVILGGGKLETKIPVIKNILPKADTLLVGGALANTYLKAKGYKNGKSLVSDDLQKEALKYGSNKKVVMPVDLVVGSWDGKRYRIVDVEKKPHRLCAEDEAILDIGPKTIQLFSKYIKGSKTLLWNGAMGYFEQSPYHIGTMSLSHLVADQSKGKTFGIIGGGETIQTMKMAKGLDDIDLVSTGGGAMLEFLSGKELPGIKILG